MKKNVNKHNARIEKRAAKPGKKTTVEKLSMDDLRQYVRAQAADWLKDPNLTSIGIGYKQTGGVPTQELSIQFSVRSKVAPQAIDSLGSECIPKSIVIRGVAVPTDVVERSFSASFETVKLEAKGGRRTRVEVVQPGISVGSVNTTAGTIGALVRERNSGKIVLLSNWHVFQGPAGAIGNRIVQPGKHDDNRVDKNIIGQLLRSHLGPAGDCAIASISGRGLNPVVFELGVTISAIGDPQLGERVVKSGRTTGVTNGVVTRIEVNTSIDYGAGVKAVVGGFEIGADPLAPARNDEISKTGDSGAAWLAIDKTGKPAPVMLGLHFGGDQDGTSGEFALACYAKSVMTALEVEPAGDVQTAFVQSADESDFRTGFDRNFLDFAVNPPGATRSRKSDLATLDGAEEIAYCHFSVWLSRTRKYPLCVAWNIDGKNFKRVNRVGFRSDRRGDLAQFQLTDAIYKHNPFDKGHIARRADLCWGTVEEARQGNYDSCYFTNIAPQHEAFNQSDNTDADDEGGLWGRLENTILDSENPHQLRISVFAGPVFGPNDRRFEQNGESCLIPEQYWKVIAYTGDVDKRQKVYGFLLTQPALIKDLTVPQDLDLDAWTWARITLNDLSDLTGLKFGAELRAREVPFVTPQSLAAGPRIKFISNPAEYFQP